MKEKKKKRKKTSNYWRYSGQGLKTWKVATVRGDKAAAETGVSEVRLSFILLSVMHVTCGRSA